MRDLKTCSSRFPARRGPAMEAAERRRHRPGLPRVAGQPLLLPGPSPARSRRGVGSVPFLPTPGESRRAGGSLRRAGLRRRQAQGRPWRADRCGADVAAAAGARRRHADHAGCQRHLRRRADEADRGRARSSTASPGWEEPIAPDDPHALARVRVRRCRSRPARTSSTSPSSPASSRLEPRHRATQHHAGRRDHRHAAVDALCTKHGLALAPHGVGSGHRRPGGLHACRAAKSFTRYARRTACPTRCGTS